MTELQKEILSFVKENHFRATPNDVVAAIGLGKSEEVLSELNRLQDDSYLFIPHPDMNMIILNKAFVEMGWADAEEVKRNEERLKELEGQLTQILAEMAKIKPVQFIDINSEYVYIHVPGIELSLADDKVYINLTSPERNELI